MSFLSLVMKKYHKFKEEHKEQIQGWKISFKILWKNPLMKIGMVLLFSLIFIAIFAPWISPYPQDAMSLGTVSHSQKGNITVYAQYTSIGSILVDNHKEWKFYPAGSGETIFTGGNASITSVRDNKTQFNVSSRNNIPVRVEMNVSIVIHIKNYNAWYVNFTGSNFTLIDMEKAAITYLNIGGSKNFTFSNFTSGYVVWNTFISIYPQSSNHIKIDATTTVSVILKGEKSSLGEVGVTFWQPPSWKHPFGTDYYNRDIMSRVFFGTRIAFFIAIVVIAICLTLGVPLGIFAGYYGGIVDEVIMRITDIFLAFPALLLAMLLTLTLGPNLLNAMFAIAIAWWPWYTRIMRNMVVSLKERNYIMAAKATGLKTGTIITKFILPNSLAPILVQATLDMGSVILAEAALAFLGLGARPPTPDWGLMISQEASNIIEGIWWPSVFPGIFIFLTVLSFNLMGDAIREFLDPKIRLKRFMR